MACRLAWFLLPGQAAGECAVRHLRTREVAMPENPIEAIVDQQRGWLDPLGKRLAERIEDMRRQGPAGQKALDLLHGVWLGHPLHAAATDLPIGAWTVGAALDTIEAFAPSKALSACADGAIALGLLGGLVAAPAGAADWHHLTGRDRRLGLVHGLLNSTVTILYAKSLLLRRMGWRPLGLSVGLLAYTIAAFAAYLGGELVYRKGIGVDRTAWEKPPKEFVPVLAEADLVEGKLTKVTAKGVRLLLLKRHGHLHALDETCTHLGGPLAEGQLLDDAVVCPWHGSTFALEDGHVLTGPAVFPERAYEVRLNEGQIEVRLAR
jgi:nitrite reductase/ring-hydroxylating ferredoxin subunit/uncharacterized membrane protein